MKSHVLAVAAFVYGCFQVVARVLFHAGGHRCGHVRCLYRDGLMFRYIGDAAGAEACENEKQENDCKGTAGGLTVMK
mgnify:CR=1 FL=1